MVVFCTRLEEELYAQVRLVCHRRGDRVYRDRSAQQCRGWLLSNGRDWLSLVSLLLGSQLYLPAPSRLPARPLLVPLISLHATNDAVSSADKRLAQYPYWARLH